MARVLLISSSRVYGTGFLDHAEAAIRRTLADVRRIAFVPYALHDRTAYTTLVRDRFEAMGIEVDSLHESTRPERAIESASAIFVGGGNTFRLLTALYEHALLAPIRSRVQAGTPYIGSSAGSVVAGPTLKTTKDMPIVQPPSFDSLGLVPFQISPHYLDADPASTHMGETQEERILQFLEENDRAVVGLREGAILWVEDGSVRLEGVAGARIFRRSHEPVETLPGVTLGPLLASAEGGG